ncbi:MAG: bifunctional diaminohydroxyphosphoribosylaminopyrimidine deaminase/5-amino-6-(5-phosphoribosylamino)uracil reductase RibD [Rheinheimera sp.]|nr:bifunctional diaminohydroxyphosphoribosylaminopyrimidine deaminase/5-amino-6-(5-phosphoribosylamino)uracil reductase RibD [Rheinheimera sp.]
MSMATSFSASDHQFMQQAIALAELGRYTTAPNPNVGCVIVKDNQVIGEGFHRQAGGPHAEVFALRQAGATAVGATAYVTLEPCSHFGRTPPCADALIAAGLSRVVIAMQDPNPRVAGTGAARLRAAGIQVDVGLLASQAEALNPGFLHKMRTQQPYVRLKLACSTDGKVALANGQSQWLTGEAAREDVQLFRAQSCAILSTAETVKADKALLNVRSEAVTRLENGAVRHPLRVILDRRCRLTGHEPLFQQGGDILLCHAGPSEEWSALAAVPQHVSCQVTRLRLGLDAVGQLDLSELLVMLGRRQINMLWVEAGSTLATSFWQQQLIDELVLYQAPLLLGADALPLLKAGGLSQLSQAPRWQWQDVRQIGADLRLTAYLKPATAPKL